MRTTAPLPHRLASALLLVAAGTAAAQPQSVIRVRLTDAGDVPVPGAEVILLRGFDVSLGRSVSDSFGIASFAFAGAKGEYQVRARKIGFTFGDRVFQLDRPADTASYRVYMQPIVRRLDSVRVTAGANPRMTDLYIDADSIAASPRPLTSAWDILTKLRPDMLRGRSGACGGVQEIWINDKRVRDFVIPAPMATARRNVGVRPGSTYSLRAFAILSEIDPLHIEQMTYRDCDDFSKDLARAQNALFITLKQGVEYVPGEGSFVLDDMSSHTPAKQPRQ